MQREAVWHHLHTHTHTHKHTHTHTHSARQSGITCCKSSAYTQATHWQHISDTLATQGV